MPFDHDILQRLLRLATGDPHRSFCLLFCRALSSNPGLHTLADSLVKFRSKESFHRENPLVLQIFDGADFLSQMSSSRFVCLIVRGKSLAITSVSSSAKDTGVFGSVVSSSGNDMMNRTPVI